MSSSLNIYRSSCFECVCPFFTSTWHSSGKVTSPSPSMSSILKAALSLSSCNNFCWSMVAVQNSLNWISPLPSVSTRVKIYCTACYASAKPIFLRPSWNSFFVSLKSWFLSMVWKTARYVSISFSDTRQPWINYMTAF